MGRRLPKSIRFLLFCIFIMGSTFGSSPAYSAEQTPAPPAPLALCTESTARIMPLGDSITAGSSSGTPVDPQYYIGYRRDLWNSLKAAGYAVDIVGSQQGGQFYAGEGFDYDHEGHPGYTDTQIAMNIYDNGENWLGDLGANWPHIILLHIGTNLLDTSPADVENILQEIQDFENAAPDRHITVILARIIDMVPNSSTLHTFNVNVANMAQARIDAGDDIVIVDMEDGAGLAYRNYSEDPPGDFFDNLHPWTTGYAKMAAVWEAALEQVFLTCNNPPVITSNPGDQNSAENDVISLDFEATEQDTEQTLSWSAESLPPGLTMDSQSGTISGTIDYSAAEGGTSGAYSVSVKVTDNGLPLASDTYSFTWTVTNTNRPPNAGDDEYLATEEQILEVPAPGILENDSDPDGDPITAALVSAPAHGNLTLSANGAFSYNPYDNYFGLDSFTYKANDGAADSEVATVEITVAGVQDPPGMVNPGNQLNAETDAVALQIHASDVDGDALNFSIEGQPSGLQIDPETGLITGFLDYGSAADSPYQVTVTVSDGSQSDSATFSWTVLESPRLLFLPMIAGK